MTVRTISWSEIDTWRQCPFKWRLSYAERWVHSALSPALSKGILWHSVLEKHYRILQATGSLAKAMDSVLAYLDALYDIDTVADDTVQRFPSEHIDLARWMYAGYIQFWQQKDAELEIIEIEARRELPLIEGVVNIKCRIDWLVKDPSGYFWLYDHKAQKNLPSKRECDLDDQFAIYQWILNQCLGSNIFGVIHNSARTQQNQGPMPLNTRFSRTTIVHTEAELATMVDEIRSTAFDIVAAYDHLDMPETLITPRHPDPERCKWKCGFTEPCLLGRGTEPERVRHMLKDLEFRQDFTRH